MILYSFVQLIDLRVLVHDLLIQIYCMGHSILWGRRWVLVDSDSDIVLEEDRVVVVDEVEDRNRGCGLGGSNRLWVGCFLRLGCLLLCRRSLHRGLPFSHGDSDDGDDSEVQLGLGGWWEGFLAGFTCILL